MKTILITIAAILMLTCQSKAQTGVDSLRSQMHKAGNYMTRYSKTMSTGIALQVTGIVITGFAVTSTKANNSGYLIGGGLWFTGLLITMSAQPLLKKAGITLQGNTLQIPLSKRKVNK